MSIDTLLTAKNAANKFKSNQQNSASRKSGVFKKGT